MSMVMHNSWYTRGSPRLSEANESSMILNKKFLEGKSDEQTINICDDFSCRTHTAWEVKGTSFVSKINSFDKM